MCERELGNPRDPFAISVIKESTIVGHVPHKISAICSMFLHTGVTIINAETTGSTFDTS